VTKLDRLGRDAIDVSTTVKALAEMGARVYCLALGGADLTSSSGTMTMQVLNAVAQFERDLLIERTQSGLRRAKSEGKVLGHPSTLTDKQKQDVRKDLGRGDDLRFWDSQMSANQIQNWLLEVSDGLRCPSGRSVGADQGLCAWRNQRQARTAHEQPAFP
jgi:hypothetical protein